MGASVTVQNPNGTKTTTSFADAVKMAEEKERKRFEVPEGKTANEYKALAQKFSDKYKEMVTSTNKLLGDIDGLNYKSRANELRRIANKEGFENANPYIGGSNDLLIRKNEQICTLIVVIIVLITAFIIVGCYMFMRGSMPSRGTGGVAADST